MALDPDVRAMSAQGTDTPPLFVRDARTGEVDHRQCRASNATRSCR